MFQKYAAAIVPIVTAVLVFFKSAITDNTIEPSEVVQVLVIGAGAFGIYWVPLLDAKWRGAWKTGIAIVIAGGTVLAPLIVDGAVSTDDWLVFALALVGALGTELGVEARASVINAVTSLDPEGEKALGVEQYAYIAPDLESDAQAAALVSTANGRTAKP